MQVNSIAGVGSAQGFATREAFESNPSGSEFVVHRNTYDAQHGSGRGKLVRTDDDSPVADKDINAAHDNAQVVVDFYHDLFGRNSIDDKGMRIDSIVHYGRNYNNAFWDGSKMTYGDGDGKFFGPLAQGLDVVGHEMTHGVTEHTSGLEYYGQSGALNESWSDVMGELIEQWHEQGSKFGTLDAAKAADWLVGEDVMTPGIAGDALRSMKAPGTAYSGDRQPADMAHYVKTGSDNGGVHTNSGIPNHAAYIVGTTIGSLDLAKIWYTADKSYLKANSNFSDAAAATYAAALEVFGKGSTQAQAVQDAWKAVGVVASATPAKITVHHFDPKLARDTGGITFPKNYTGPVK